ncbi:hypothetical protein Tco_1233226, partial [Tanacetum coccineum]
GGYGGVGSGSDKHKLQVWWCQAVEVWWCRAVDAVEVWWLQRWFRAVDSTTVV